MKNYSFILSLLVLIFSCKENKEVKNKTLLHNPFNDLSHSITDTTAVQLFVISSEYIANKKYDSAILFLNYAIKFEENPILFNELGIVEVLKKNNTKAMEHLNFALSLDSNYYPTYINIARIHLKEKRFLKAEKILNKLIENSNNEYWIAYGHFFMTLRYFNDDVQCESAVSHFKQTSKIREDEILKTSWDKISNTLIIECNL